MHSINTLLARLLLYWYLVSVHVCDNHSLQVLVVLVSRAHQKSACAFHDFAALSFSLWQAAPGVDASPVAALLLTVDAREEGKVQKTDVEQRMFYNLKQFEQKNSGDGKREGARNTFKKEQQIREFVERW